MKKKDFLTVMDFGREELERLFRLAAEIKANPEKYSNSLEGKTLGMIFQKPSTRTRVSFEVGIYQLGGLGLYFSAADLQIGRGETIADTARVLSRYLSAIVARVYGHDQIEELARHAAVPVINGLSDAHHPCQALADYFTLLEKKGKLRGLKLAYVGDGNNVAHSLIEGAARLGVNISLATPSGYRPSREILDKASADAKANGGAIELAESPEQAVEGADAVYTDVWVSMGQEKEQEARVRAFAGFQVNEKLMARAKPDAIFLHCLPAHRGWEVTDQVMDSERSAVWDQAENRLHTQKALLLMLLKN